MAQQPSVGGAGAATPGPSQGAGRAPPAALAAGPAPGPAQPAAVPVAPVALVAAPVPAVGQVVAPVAGPVIPNLAGVLVVGVQARDDIQAGLMGPPAKKCDVRFTIWP